MGEWVQFSFYLRELLVRHLKKDYLAKIMDESSKLEPFLIRVFSPDPLSSLECMYRVGKIYVWIGFINHVIQFVQSLKDCGLKVVKL